MAGLQQLSLRAPPADVDCPRFISSGQDTSLVLSLFPPRWEQQLHLWLYITDQLEVGQSTLWSRMGQVAKKTQACQGFLPAKAAATSFLLRWAGSASFATAGDRGEQMALLGPDSSQIAREVWAE